MKTLFIILILLFCMTTTINAQILRFGVKGGTSIKLLEFDQVTLGNTKIYNGKNTDKLGYHVGIFSRLQIPGFLFFQPELLYNNITSGIILSSNGIRNKARLRIQTYDLPVMVGFHIGFLRLNAGPVFSLNTKSTLTGKGVKLKMEQKANQIGYQAGIGLDIEKFSVEFRYGSYIKDCEYQFQLDNTVKTIKAKRDDQFILSIALTL